MGATQNGTPWFNQITEQWSPEKIMQRYFRPTCHASIERLVLVPGLPEQPPPFGFTQTIRFNFEHDMPSDTRDAERRQRRSEGPRRRRFRGSPDRSNGPFPASFKILPWASSNRSFPLSFSKLTRSSSLSPCILPLFGPFSSDPHEIPHPVMFRCSKIF